MNPNADGDYPPTETEIIEDELAGHLAAEGPPDEVVEAEIIGEDYGEDGVYPSCSPIKEKAVADPFDPHDRVAILESSGGAYNAGLTAKREMPKKELGKHRFAALATFYLSPEQAEAGHQAGNQVMLDPSNIVMFGVVCVDCDTPYAHLRKTCPAPPSGWWS